MMNSTSTFAHEENVPENQDINMLDQSAINVTVNMLRFTDTLILIM